MFERLDKYKAELAKARQRKAECDARVRMLEKKCQEEEKTAVHEMMKAAEASALTYSSVETAKVNGADVYYYLKYLLMKCPTSLTCDEEREKLCPWNPECKEALDELHRQHQKAIFDAM
ncbi:protein of unknown function [Butyrivibrio proteoclasticus]|uniref:Uncharacterized protein n=1 Tax=Butyrivibrio proteoclasticus TaxID=43305 RepID=A0A1I5YRN9_9FIRM|nr:DUF4315 family protein [Butyrivibrio proteoclasticus]SFQ46891.1 protein of unknown function [Butyrivibrio proteoclasticus]